MLSQWQYAVHTDVAIGGGRDWKYVPHPIYSLLCCTKWCQNAPKHFILTQKFENILVMGWALLSRFFLERRGDIPPYTLSHKFPPTSRSWLRHGGAFLRFSCKKIIQSLRTRCASQGQNAPILVFGRCFILEPTGGAYDARPRTLVGLGGDTRFHSPFPSISTSWRLK